LATAHATPSICGGHSVSSSEVGLLRDRVCGVA
jgi:hypothetical protein